MRKLFLHGYTKVAIDSYATISVVQCVYMFAQIPNLNCMGHTMQYGQYLTHVHSHITQAVVAMDSHFKMAVHGCGVCVV